MPISNLRAKNLGKSQTKKRVVTRRAAAYPWVSRLTRKSRKTLI